MSKKDASVKITDADLDTHWMTVWTKNHSGSHLEKYFQEFISEKNLILLRDGPCLQLMIVSSIFQALLLLQNKLLESVWKRLVPLKKSQKSKGSENRYFQTFSGILWDFSADPKKTLLRLFCAISGPEGLETTVDGGSGRNHQRPDSRLFNRPCGKCYLLTTCCFRINLPKVTNTDTDR